MLHFALMISSWSIFISIVGFCFMLLGLTFAISLYGHTDKLFFVMAGVFFLGMVLIINLVVAERYIVPNSYIQQQSRSVKRYIRSDLVLSNKPLTVGELVHIQHIIPRHKIAQQQLAAAM